MNTVEKVNDLITRVIALETKMNKIQKEFRELQGEFILYETLKIDNLDDFEDTHK